MSIRVILLENVHETWLPKGTIGHAYMDKEGCMRFIPENPVKGYGFHEQGAYVGGMKVMKLYDKEPTK